MYGAYGLLRFSKFSLKIDWRTPPPPTTNSFFPSQGHAGVRVQGWELVCWGAGGFPYSKQFLGFLVSWFLGFLVSWFQSLLVSWFPHPKARKLQWSHITKKSFHVFWKVLISYSSFPRNYSTDRRDSQRESFAKCPQFPISNILTFPNTCFQNMFRVFSWVVWSVFGVSKDKHILVLGLGATSENPELMNLRNFGLSKNEIEKL